MRYIIICLFLCSCSRYSITRMNVRPSDGRISVEYMKKGRAWAKDYMSRRQFKRQFGFKVTNYE